MRVGEHRRHRRSPPHEGGAQGAGAHRPRADPVPDGVEAPQPQHRPGAHRARGRRDRRGGVRDPTRASSTKIPSTKELLASAAAEAKSSGCGPITTTGNFGNAPGTDPAIDHAHIGTAPVTSPPPLSQYPTIPPASGPHEPTPLPAGVYNRPPDIYASIHSLEHAGATIWYAPSAANSDAVKQIKAFYSQKANVGQSKVIVAPYDYSSQGIGGSLPSGVQMAVVAWHRRADLRHAEPRRGVQLHLAVLQRPAGRDLQGCRPGAEPAAVGAHGEEAAQTPAPAAGVHGRGSRQAASAPPKKTPDPARRERKERARLAEEAARKQRARRGALRRAMIFALVGLLLFGFLWWRQRAPAPRLPIAAAAVTAAKDARLHRRRHALHRPRAGAPRAGPDHHLHAAPAHLGDPQPLAAADLARDLHAPGGRDEAVHFLEHAGVIIYYRADGTDALPADVVIARWASGATTSPTPC